MRASTFLLLALGLALMVLMAPFVAASEEATTVDSTVPDATAETPGQRRHEESTGTRREASLQEERKSRMAHGRARCVACCVLVPASAFARV